jgi:signal transduction histidine kinase
LIAGISHDLNTPLAAIQSASDMLRTSIHEFGSTAVQRWDRLDHGQRDLFYRVLGEVLASEPYLDSKAEREARQRLTLDPRLSGKPHVAELARLLVDIGLGEREFLLAQLLAVKDPLLVAKALEPLATIHQLSTVIAQAAGRAAGVVGALRVLLRGNPATEKSNVDVRQSIEEILPLFQPQRRKGLAMTVALEQAWVSAWPEKLTQVWVNLLSNAVHAAGPRGNVAITLRLVEGEALVRVENDGPEIPASIREHLFEVFFTTKAPGEGTGLGLYVCRKITEELGGQITFESDPNRTAFLVRLPSDQEA